MYEPRMTGSGWNSEVRARITMLINKKEGELKVLQSLKPQVQPPSETFDYLLRMADVFLSAATAVAALNLPANDVDEAHSEADDPDGKLTEDARC